MTAGAETNVPLLVAGVFAITFLVVGAIAYLVLFRQSHADSPAAATPPPPPDRSTATAPWAGAESAPVAPPPGEPGPIVPSLSDPPDANAADVNTMDGRPADSSGRLLVHLYRALMLTTGIAGLVASALMFSAVEGLTLLPVAALLIAAFSIYSIYRGFVPDRELRTRPPTARP